MMKNIKPIHASPPSYYFDASNFLASILVHGIRPCLYKLGNEQILYIDHMDSFSTIKTVLFIHPFFKNKCFAYIYESFSYIGL